MSHKRTKNLTFGWWRSTLVSLCILVAIHYSERENSEIVWAQIEIFSFKYWQSLLYHTICEWITKNLMDVIKTFTMKVKIWNECIYFENYFKMYENITFYFPCSLTPNKVSLLFIMILFDQWFCIQVNFLVSGLFKRNVSAGGLGAEKGRCRAV